MTFYVYIIQSEIDNSYYKGFSENYSERLEQHNKGLSNYTSRKLPWKLVHLETYSIKTDALKREKVLKKYSHFQIEHLIKSTKNKLERPKGVPNAIGD